METLRPDDGLARLTYLQPAIVRRVRNRLRNRLPDDVAEDIAQEVLLALWRRWWDETNPYGVKQDREILMLASGITDYKVADHYRRLATRATLTDRLNLELSRVPDGSLYDPWPDLPVDLRDAVALLPARQREVVELIVLRRMSHREAAEALGVQKPTVTEHMRRATARLRLLVA